MPVCPRWRCALWLFSPSVHSTELVLPPQVKFICIWGREEGLSHFKLWGGSKFRYLPLQNRQRQITVIEIISCIDGYVFPQWFPSNTLLWKTSPISASAGAGLGQAEPLSSFPQITLPVSTGCAAQHGHNHFFFNWKGVAEAAGTTLVSLLPSCKDLWQKVDALHVFLLSQFLSESGIIFTDGKHIFLKSYLYQWWICFGISNITKEEKTRTYIQ